MEVALSGAFRSGTNVVRALLELNHGVTVVHAGGWKHAPVPVSEQSPVVGVVKDPYAWLVSMWTYTRDRGARGSSESLTHKELEKFTEFFAYMMLLHPTCRIEWMKEGH